MAGKRARPSGWDLEPELVEEVKRLHARTEEEIEAAARTDPLNPPLTREELEEMELAFPATKQLISVRIDRPVIEWFKQQGPGYQTRMNAVLRNYFIREQVKREKGRDPLEAERHRIRIEKLALRRRTDLRREEEA